MIGRLHRGSLGPVSTIIPVQDSEGNAYTLPAGSGTLKVALKPTDDIYIVKTGSSGSTRVRFYLCNSNNTARVAICYIDVSSGSPIKSGSVPASDADQTHDLSALAGGALYARFETVTGSGFSFTDNLPIEIKGLYTAVTSGNKIEVADINQTGTSISAGTVMSNSHFSAGTKVEASTFNSQVLGL